jgi:DNA adenine methylase
MDTNKGSRTDVMANRVAGKPFSRRSSSAVLPISIAPYPGKKQWFVPYAAKFFRAHPCQTLIEPFAGSAIVGLSLLHAGMIERLVLVEKDKRIACLLNGLVNDPKLADRYEAFNCTLENVKNLFRIEQTAFRYLVQSRCCNRARFDGGLYTQIDSHWCCEQVVANTRRVYAMRDRIKVIHGDALEEMRKYAADRTVGCFADPPYTADISSKGYLLYLHHKLDHKKLFALLAQWRGSWLLTEDNSRMVRRLAACYRFNIRRVRMKTADSRRKTELVMWRKRRVF